MSFLNSIQKAKEAYGIALKINPELFEIHYNLGVLLQNHQRNEAYKHYRKALEIEPSYFNAHIMLGIMCIEDGLFDDSIASIKAALAYHPQNADLWNNLGYSYYSIKMYLKAIEQYTKALRLDPQHALAHYNKALAHYAIQQFDKAIINFDEAIRLKYPGSSKFRAALKPYRENRSILHKHDT